MAAKQLCFTWDSQMALRQVGADFNRSDALRNVQFTVHWIHITCPERAPWRAVIFVSIDLAVTGNWTSVSLVLLGLVAWVSCRDVPDIWFRLAGYPATFSNPVPTKTVPGTGYLSRIVLGPFWHLVELSSPSECEPYCKTVGLHDSLVVSHVDKLFYIY